MSEAALLGGRGRSASTGKGDWLLLGAALIASAVLVWLAGEEPLAAVAYLGGAAVLAVPVRAFLRRERPEVPAAEPAGPDWSVTLAAIDRSDVAVAISDRAGRMVCANGVFERWFGASSAPPRLPLDGDAERRLANLARAAWRDGAALAEGLSGAGRRWRAEARRCGRADDHLVWTIAPLIEEDILARAGDALRGKAGAILGRAGLHAALVTADGRIVAANPEFARRALDEAQSTAADADFAGCLRQDERGRIVYAREGGKGASLRLLEVPLADPADDALDPATSPSLMLLFDAGLGAGEASVQIPEIEALLARLPLGLAMANRDGRLLFANEAFLRAAGHADRVTPTYPADLVIREDKGVIADAVRRYAQGVAATGDVSVRLRSAPGEPVTLSLAGVRGLGDAAVLLSLKDTSEEARLKRQIAQATKMQAVGQLAGGVAHDFNNVLTAIMGFCDLMLLRHTPGDSDYDDIQQIKANSNRAASLTRQLLAFSRQQTLRPQVVQLPDIVSEVSHMLRRLLGERIALEVSHARDLGPVRADPGQLEQVIVNLVVNARDAILARKDRSSGGKVTLRTLPVSAEDVRRMKNDIMPIADYTALVVEDTGGGIPPDILGKIFEPFFTTKEIGKGTGLGLSTVYGIVKQSGGFVFADSQPGSPGKSGGARFTVYLPVHEGADEDAAQPGEGSEAVPPPAAAWARGGRLLLVEDEETVRAVAERALTRAGHQVTTARDGEEGVEAAGAAAFDLIVSDVVMPGMGGPAMAGAIRKQGNGVPILFMSGYAEEQLRREIDLPNVHFLAKPFSVAQIGEAVQRILREGARQPSSREL